MTGPAMVITKCCNRAKHTQKCVSYWHERQREEVRKRVAVESALDKQLLATESVKAAAEEQFEALWRSLLDYAHEFALTMEQRRVWLGLKPAEMRKMNWPVGKEKQ